MAIGSAWLAEEVHAQFVARDNTTGNAQGGTATGESSTAVGNTATASGGGSVAVGGFATASGSASTAIGYVSNATAGFATAFGANSIASGVRSTAIGHVATAQYFNSIAIGYYSTTARNDQIMFGRADNTYTVPGITSAASLAALSGSGQFVTSDASGNLALTNSTSGRVGLGTFAPDVNSRLDIRSSSLLNGVLMKRTDAGPHYLRIEDSTGSVFRCGVQGNGDTHIGALTPGRGLALVAGGTGKLTINASGQFSFGNPPPPITTHAMVTSTGALLTTGGVWTDNSSRATKQDIEPITSDEARETVRALQPVGYRYKSELNERYVGFIAEDVPELVATRDRKGLAPMDITAVLTKVVQDQDKLLVDQNRQLADERQRNDKQERMIESLMQRLTDLEQRDHAAVSAK